MSRKVKKMLSPNEMAILSNIGSLLDQLKQMGTGEGPVESPEEVLEAEPVNTEEEAMEEEVEEKEVKMIVKGLETTPSDSATASDDAEERMDEVLPELTEENVTEVEKAFGVLLKHLSKNVSKSQQSPKLSPTIQLMSKIVEVQKSSQDRLNDIGEALGHILNGIGISKQLEVTKPKKTEPQSINKSQTDELLQVLKSLTNENKKEEKSKIHSQNNQIRKNLGDVNILTGMLKRY